MSQISPPNDELTTDGYWLRMGALAVDALGDALRDDLTPRRRQLIAEYLGGVMDNAYNMGIRLGKASAVPKTLPTVAEMSGSVHDFTNGKTMKEYMKELSGE